MRAFAHSARRVFALDVIARKRVKDGMIDLALSVQRIEKTLAMERIPRQRFLKLAGIAPSTWSRWKSGEHSPTFKKWNSCEVALSQLVG